MTNTTSMAQHTARGLEKRDAPIPAVWMPQDPKLSRDAFRQGMRILKSSITSKNKPLTKDAITAYWILAADFDEVDFRPAVVATLRERFISPAVLAEKLTEARDARVSLERAAQHAAWVKYSDETSTLRYTWLDEPTTDHATAAERLTRIITSPCGSSGTALGPYSKISVERNAVQWQLNVDRAYGVDDAIRWFTEACPGVPLVLRCADGYGSKWERPTHPAHVVINPAADEVTH
jgi:hypothetical protein